MIELRDYQERATNNGLRFLFEGQQRSGLILMPTGTGKSVVIGETVNRIKYYYPAARIVMLTHVKELVEQNHEKAVSMCSHDIGLWSAGLRKKQYGSDIVFAGIDTVARNPQHLSDRHIVLIDEAHRVAHRPNTNYRNVTDHLLQHNPNLKVLGYTATGYRMGQGIQRQR